MQRKLSLVVMALLVSLPMLAQDMTLEQVIAKNIEAHGGLAKMKAVNSAKATGKMVMSSPQGTMEAPIVMYMRRPGDIKMEFTFQGLTGTQAYDGQSSTAWAVMPFQGKKDAEQMPPDEAREMSQQAADGFEGPFVGYAARGDKVELLGKDKVEGSDVYKLKLTRKSGDVETYFIDADSFLEVRQETKRTVRGSEVESETVIGDYKEVNGLVMPFSMDSGRKGSPGRQKIVIDKYELNVPLEHAQFVMPPPAPKAATPEEKKEPAQTTPAKPEDKPKSTTDKPKS